MDLILLEGLRKLNLKKILSLKACFSFISYVYLLVGMRGGVDDETKNK